MHVCEYVPTRKSAKTHSFIVLFFQAFLKLFSHFSISFQQVFNGLLARFWHLRSYKNSKINLIFPPINIHYFLTGTAPITVVTQNNSHIYTLFGENKQEMSSQNTNLSTNNVNIDTFDNPNPQRDYQIEINCPEFTSVCPKTGQPDFGTINITYCPNERCIELKSLKFYLQSYRNKGIFYEFLVNRILDDLVQVCKPRWMVITGKFTARGGITTNVTARHN